MLNQLDAALNFDRQALGLRAERQQVLAGNVANADTPSYKARDFDFTRALAAATGRADLRDGLVLATTARGHLTVASASSQGGARALKYRVPDQPSLDGNTVNMDVERAAFADNTVRYETSLSLMNLQFRNLKIAMAPDQ
ncbi:MAG TPA: flagellar basal body rod protein FlgB [Rhodanobacteraceae bacterium]|nr:flagellar basal body rod protein FlgB [Rhodanobacteraceae bacterium]